MTRPPPRRHPALVAFLAILALAGYWLGGSPSTGEVSAPQPAPRQGTLPEAAPAPSPRPRAAPTQGLPPEALQTIALIKAGGPFPYEKDGTEFRNREGRLPARGRGHYREYTVPTPGASTRGARRIVTGADGEFFYTDDHYETFRALDAAELDATAPRR